MFVLRDGHHIFIDDTKVSLVCIWHKVCRKNGSKNVLGSVITNELRKLCRYMGIVLLINILTDFITRQLHIIVPLFHADFLNLPSSLDQNTELPQKISSSRCHGLFFSPPESSLPSGRCDDGVRRAFICRQVCQRILIAESRGPRPLFLVERLEDAVRRANYCRLILPDQVHLAPSHMMGYLLCWAL